MGRRTEKRLRLLLAAAGSVMILLTQTPPQTVRSNLSLWAREITGWFGDAQTPAWLAHPLTDDAVFWFGVTLVMVAAGWTATSYIRRGTGTDARGALAPSQQPNDAKAETGTRFDLYVHLRPNAANILNRDNLRKQDDDPPGVHTPHIVREDDTPESGKTRSHLSPEFYSCSILGKDVTVEPIDATLCGIGSLFQRLERHPDFFPQLENNTYINLSFVRDDGYRFEIVLKKRPGTLKQARGDVV